MTQSLEERVKKILADNHCWKEHSEQYAYESCRACKKEQLALIKDLAEENQKYKKQSEAALDIDLRYIQEVLKLIK